MVDKITFEAINPKRCVNGKIRRIHRVIDGIYQTHLAPFQLKGSMLSMLFVIGKNHGVTQKKLSDFLVLDQSTVSRDVKKLVNRKLVTTSSGADARSELLTLTDQGYEFLDEVSPVWHKVHVKIEAVLGDFSIKYLDVLMEALLSVNEI